MSQQHYLLSQNTKKAEEKYNLKVDDLINEDDDDDDEDDLADDLDNDDLSGDDELEQFYKQNNLYKYKTQSSTNQTQQSIN
jgi:hypothetical protein